MKKMISLMLGICLMVMLTGCSSGGGSTQEKTLPKPSVDTESMFGVDKNINIGTIDEWLGREDVVYVDVRMLVDPGGL